ncbi:MAG: T9SS type A sorting domain-containing protein [Candidatus Cloacimonadota bacterium]|nr:MAG: T9SS type A sorting domain-containing protein [Candidatus Cloacimonadota bacterium]
MQRLIHLLISLIVVVSFLWVVESSAQGWGPATNLGSNINTSYLEDGNSISQDSSKLYLSSDRPGGLGGADVWVSEYVGGWQVPVNLGGNVNTVSDEYEPSISSDRTKLYFSSYRSGGYGVSDIYVSEYVGGVWQPAVNLGPNINTADNEGCPSVSTDGSKLFFVSDRPGGYGWTDIWFAESSGDSWMLPVNLGDSINSPDNDLTPCISNDGLKLYFASTRAGGYGEFDIWQSENISGVWQSPTNLGPNINTSSSEAGANISSNGMKLYFAAYGWPGGYGGFDIWLSEYQTNIEEEFVKGSLIDENELSLCCFPNIAFSHIKILYSIPKASQISVSLYDLAGKKVRTLVDCYTTPGQYTFDWPINNDLPAGTYFCHLKSGNISKTEKILIIK